MKYTSPQNHFAHHLSANEIFLCMSDKKAWMVIYQLSLENCGNENLLRGGKILHKVLKTLTLGNFFILEREERCDPKGQNILWKKLSAFLAFH